VSSVSLSPSEPSEGRSRTSDGFDFVISRREGPFQPAPFTATPGERRCGRSPIVEVDPPREQEFMYRVIRRGGSVSATGSFVVVDSLGGVALSPCCDKVAVLSFLGGGRSGGAAAFNLLIYDVETGDNLLPRPTTINSTSGSGSSDGFQEPRIYFSPDCTIVAAVSKDRSGRDAVDFYDLERRVAPAFTPRLPFPSIDTDGFSARINSDNEIEYSINEVEQPSIPIPVD